MLVLRNAGPQGGPGMPEWGMLPIPKKLVKQGVRDMVRLSDARMSGTSYGACILHVSPESYIGGPLALVRTGDMITLDVDARTINIDVSEEELAKRRAAWKAPEPRYERGYGWMFTRHIKQADEGCDFDFLETGFRRAGRRAGDLLTVIPGLDANARPGMTRGATMTKLSDATRDKLKTVSTATVATALFKRGFRNQMIQDVHPLGPDQPVLVGEAFTLRYMPAREDLNTIERVPRPRPSAAQGGRGLPARRGAGDGQPQGRARGLRRRHPGDAADEARRAPAWSPTAASAIPPRSPRSAFPPITTARARRPT